MRTAEPTPPIPRKRGYPVHCDVAVLGGGMSGMATAARLQARGLRTVVLEAHGHLGGCAGYYRRRGFSFDVGATTLVDFQTGGVGDELLTSIGMPVLDAEPLPGYQAWLPDRQVTLYRDAADWHPERLRTLGDSPSHRAFWTDFDTIAEVFWAASQAGVRLPLRRPADLVYNVRALGPRNLPLARHLYSTLGDLLRRHGLRDDAALVGLLSMLIEDTVHSGVDQAPLINAALGATIRGAGLTRARGGMGGFWRRFTAHYRALGGDVRTACAATRVTGGSDGFTVHTRRGLVHAAQVVSALPAQTTAALGPPQIAARLARYLHRDRDAQGGALMVFLGVPDREVAGHTFTHHQILLDYRRPLGDGNNMFVSVSAPGDIESAPAGHRAVMISTHCELGDWHGLDPGEYTVRKKETTERLIDAARLVYPQLGDHPLILESGTPLTYQRFAFRPGGAVGGTRQTLRNTNQHAIPHSLGVRGFHLVGDSTWPGLGTVACVIGSRIVADAVLRSTRRARETRAER
ncbi:MAG: amine oxidase [Actinomycetia bacterium]|nr:amine oxidase [Actinomycetes bacterium]